MHILVIPSWYPNPKNLFSGNFVKRHMELIAQNHQVTLLNFISEENTNFRIEEIQKGNLNEIQIYYPKKKSKIGQFFNLRKAFFKAVKNLKNVDLIHVHVALDKGLVGLWAKKHFKKPLFVTEHGSYFFRENYKKLSLYQKFIIAQTLKRTNAISCVSDILKTEIEYLFPFLKLKITPNFIDRELFKPLEHKNNTILQFIHISTLEKNKNVDKIIRAFELFQEESNTEFELTIIAEKRNLNIEKQIENSPITDKITLIGPIKIEEVAAKLQKANAFVLLSSHETFSCVVAEAWSCGVPVISSSVGIATNLPENAGIQIEEINSRSLAIALLQFLDKKDSFKAEEIRKLTLNFSEKAVIESFEEFYQKK